MIVKKMSTKYHKAWKGEMDVCIDNIRKGVVNLREYVDSQELEIKTVDKSIIDEKVQINKIKIRIDEKLKHISDFVLKIPYVKGMDYHKIINHIDFTVGGQHIVSNTNMYHLDFFNWLFDKQITIQDGYMYIPLSNIINIICPFDLIHRYTIDITFHDYFWEINNEESDIKKIELLCKEYLDMNHNFFNKPYEQIIIQHQEYSRLVSGEKDSIQNFLVDNLYHSVFSLFVYGFDKEDISDFKLILHEKLIIEMNLREVSSKIYILECVHPYFWNLILDEPMSATNLYYKKTINFSRIDGERIEFKKLTDKPIDFHLVGLNYNVHRRMYGMEGLGFAS